MVFFAFPTKFFFSYVCKLRNQSDALIQTTQHEYPQFRNFETYEKS